MSSTLILVHGAWHGAWCWNKLVPMLEAAGKNVIAIDLPGHGQSRESVEDQDIFSYARYVRSVVEAQPEPVILVGHSMGGFVISQAAELNPDKIEKLVYVNAFLPENGLSMEGPNAMGVLAWADAIKAGMATLSDTGKSTFMTKGLAINACYNDLSEEETDWAYGMLCPESCAAQYQEVRLGDNFQKVPRVYVKGTMDNCIPLELQNKMIAAQPCVRTYQLESAHCPFLSHPDELAKILLEESD